MLSLTYTNIKRENIGEELNMTTRKEIEEKLKRVC